MQTVMLAALGYDGEIGLTNGKLPWGSFILELEHYRLTLQKLRMQYKELSIVISMATWRGLPKSAKQFIKELIDPRVGRIYLASNTGTNLEEIVSDRTGEVISSYVKLGNTFPENLFMPNDPLVILGGKEIYQWFLEMDAVDMAVISWVNYEKNPDAKEVSLDPYHLSILQTATAIKNIKCGSEDNKSFTVDHIGLK